MKSILLLGATGNLGRVLVNTLLENNYKVKALVRNPKKIEIQHKNLEIIEGQASEKNKLDKSLKGIDVVVSVLGHGFRTKYPIQKIVLSNLIPLMEKEKINKLIAITGSALIVSGDRISRFNLFEEKAVNIFDPYRMGDAKDQQQLLEHSNLEWIVIRTPIHSNKKSKLKSVGYKKPKFWESAGRPAISEFIKECIEENKWNKKSPIIY